MKRAILPIISLLALAGIGATGPALADRPPTPEERTRIEAAVRAAGYTTWKEIELDDGVWEVDDAVDAQGKKWDLKLDPTSMSIVNRKPD